MSDIAIRVENLGKKYKLGLTHRHTIHDAVYGLGRRLMGQEAVSSGETRTNVCTRGKGRWIGP